MKTKAKRIKKPVTTEKFTCVVDSELLAKANAARVVTWREILEDAFQEVVNSSVAVKRLKALGKQ